MSSITLKIGSLFIRTLSKPIAVESTLELVSPLSKLMEITESDQGTSSGA